MFDQQQKSELSHFAFKGKLGKGNYGVAMLSDYTGSDPDILSLIPSDSNKIVVKVPIKNPNLSEAERKQAEEEVAHEITIGDHIKANSADARFKHEHPNAYINSTVPLKDANGKVIALCSKYVAYDQKNAADLSNFLIKLESLTAAESLMRDPKVSKETKDDVSEQMAELSSKYNAPVKKAFQNDRATVLHQIMSSLESDQRALNDVGVFHLDTACRNFLVNSPTFSKNDFNFSVTITDFGRSEKIPKNDVFEKPENGGPARWIDRDSFFYGKNTARTEIFGLKATMIESLGYALGAKEPREVLCLDNPNQPLSDMMNDCISNYTDEQRLEKYYAHLVKLAKNYPDATARTQMTILIQNMKPYLTSLPQSEKSLKEARNLDRAAFEKASETFENAMAAYKANPYTIPVGSEQIPKPGQPSKEREFIRSEYTGVGETPMNAAVVNDTTLGHPISDVVCAPIYVSDETTIEIDFQGKKAGFVAQPTKGNIKDTTFDINAMYTALMQNGFGAAAAKQGAPQTLIATNKITGDTIEIAYSGNEITIKKPTNAAYSVVADYIAVQSKQGRPVVNIRNSIDEKSLQAIRTIFTERVKGVAVLSNSDAKTATRVSVDEATTPTGSNPKLH